MAVSLDQLIYGIKQVESGGNYSVVNSIGAVGAYQVMKANIPSWTKMALGHSITWQEFRDSPADQDAVARYMLGKSYSKYGAEGAAAVWFSGQPNPNSTASDGGNTVRQYVNKVIGASGGYTGSSSSSKSSSSGATPVASDPATTAEDYGFVIGLMNSDPGLKKLFNQAVAGGWTSTKFQAELRTTSWWKSHSSAERTYLTKQYGDPASAKQDFNDAYVHVQQYAASLGYTDTSAHKQALNTWAYDVAAKGWTDQQLQYEIGKHVSFANGSWTGHGGTEIQNLKSYAYDMGVTMSDSWYTNNSRNIIRGIATEQDYKSQILKQAKSLFPQWSKQLDAGQTVNDLASPYMQSMSQILELSSGSLNVFDPTIKKALQYKDPSSGQTTGQPLWAFENSLRADPRWKQTTNAQSSLMQVAHQVLSDFGLKT